MNNPIGHKKAITVFFISLYINDMRPVMGVSSDLPRLDISV